MTKAGRWKDGEAGARMAAGWVEMMELAGQNEFDGIRGMWVRYSASVNVIGVLALGDLCPFIPAGK